MSRRRTKPTITGAIRELQKVEATAQCVAFAMLEETEGIDFADAVKLIAEGLAASLLTLDAVEVSIGREVRDGRK